jgi:hypothetical protein
MSTVISTVGAAQNYINQNHIENADRDEGHKPTSFLRLRRLTMIQISPTIRVFTYQETIDSGLQIRSLVFNHNCHSYHLQGRTTDTIYIFTEGLVIYVLTINKAVGYIGLHSYMQPESDPLNSMFLSNHQEIKETLGAKWSGLKPVVIVHRLISCHFSRAFTHLVFKPIHPGTAC